MERSGTHGCLGVPDGLVELAARSWPLFGDDDPSGEEVSRRLRAVLGLLDPPDDLDVRVEAEWSRDGLDGTELSWDAGFGPRVAGRLLRPAAERSALPGALHLHCHGGLKRFGLDKLADGADGRPAHPVLQRVRDDLYAGRPVAEDLARTGRAVLVHDAYGWGSRRLPVEGMPARSEHVAALDLAARSARGEVLDEVAEYDVHAGPAEDAVAKALGVLGTSWAGVVAREDLLAHRVLTGLPGVDADRTALIGLSGGGARAAVASALGAPATAVVVTCMASTLRELLPQHLHGHSWALVSPGLGRVGDWPDVVAAAAPRPLLVQFGTRDELFPAEGVRRADERIRARYGDGPYTGSRHEAGHVFDAAMQREAFAWLDEVG
ncbi:alpha/beta hydrolase family protein [Kineococcus terrestris]|uniref:alpha/beta hydrolase family protein n=1 Tax=Kineococcus terrestris TaxID=2044856 RepID=UPI0034DB15E4